MNAFHALHRAFLAAALCLGLAAALPAQTELTLLGQKTYPFLLNDIWGWVDAQGAEYALTGARAGVSIVALDQAGLPEVAFIPGTNTPWRDLKTYGDRAFVTADGNVDDGLLVIDLSQLPDTATWFQWQPEFGEQQLGACHNLYIDELGRAYLAGCNGINQGGVIILDVTSPNGVPEVLGFGPNVYAHDVFVQDGRMYTSELFEGQVGIYDVSDPTDVLSLGFAPTPFRFTHNAWVSPDNNYLFSTDERANAPTAAFDIRDLGNIRSLGQYRPAASLGTGVIPHNVHVFDRWLVLSHYTDGLRIIDAGRPSNLVETAYYDTNDTTAVGFFGAWGAYPYLPSGRILVTDIQKGLFVLAPDYQPAAWLEGVVRDARSGDPIDEASVRIEGEQPNLARSDAFGQYRTGLGRAGSYQARFEHPAYFAKRLPTVLSPDAVSTLDVELEPKPRYAVGGTVRFAESDAPAASGVVVRLANADFTYEANTAPDGSFLLEDVVEGSYQVLLRAWGGLSPEPLEIVVDRERKLDLSMVPGYEDDFSLDWNWMARSTAVTGAWARGRPDGVRFRDSLSTPRQDLANDIGDQALLTDPRGGRPRDFDVAEGEVWIRTPTIDLSRLTAPKLSFAYWFFFHQATDPALEVFLSNGQDSVLLLRVTESRSAWQDSGAIPLEGRLPDDTTSVYIAWRSEDKDQGKGILEAALDGFRLAGEQSTSLGGGASLETLDLSLFPNPFSQTITLDWARPARWRGKQVLAQFHTLDGRLAGAQTLPEHDGQVRIGASLPPGVYVLSLRAEGRLLGRSRRLIKVGN